MSNDDILTENNIIPTNFTFAAIQTAVDNANNGDTITLKEGTYLNNGNGQISISKNISFVGVKGKSILDAQKTSRIFYITAQSINITDIIFMNGLATDYGCAIYFKSPILILTLMEHTLTTLQKILLVEQTTSMKKFPIPILQEHTLTTLDTMLEQTTSMVFTVPILQEHTLTTPQNIIVVEQTTSIILFPIPILQEHTSTTPQIA